MKDNGGDGILAGKEVSIDEFELFLLLACAMRYSMTRSSGILFNVASIVRRNAGNISPRYRNNLIEDLKQSIDYADRDLKNHTRNYSDTRFQHTLLELKQELLTELEKFNEE